MAASNEKRFSDFIIARDRVRKNKEAGRSKPWTNDVILQSYRFCNVRREDDTVTRWIADNWRARLADKPDLWFWMLVARLVNNPDTLSFVHYRAIRGWKWDESAFISAMQERMAQGEKTWGGAYIVSTNGVTMEKSSYIATRVLSPAWEARKDIQPCKGDTLRAFCDRLLTLNGVQGFIAGQVIADAKYADIKLKLADDWHSFAISGPGSRRGMNRVFGQATDDPWKEANWFQAMEHLRTAVNRSIKHSVDGGALHAQDVQNCLCEFDKYERVRLGEGKPRSSYPGRK